MSEDTLSTHCDEFAVIIKQFITLRARLNVVMPEDLSNMMAVIDQSNPTGKPTTKVDYNLLFSVGMILSQQGPMTMGELSRTLDVPLSTATRIVDWLVNTNFVERRHDPLDRRIVHVGLTESGNNMLRIHGDFMRKRIEKVLRHFSEDERQNLIGLMHKLVVALEEDK